ncbi:phospholipase A2 group XV-like [Hydractinia symbiolongicarpus]|uniref:phospholipase A2 group XV-like n=1 Tax=Hydractinia symbiolongicarpus TaxID=13093 RepID=UPI00254D4352|nr:phospholipase A2 group XV-like [Hydractinia symbiolongicarpus]
MDATLVGIILFSALQTCNALSPVVIVPGTGGNQLEAKLVNKPAKPAFYCYSSTSSYFRLWLDIKSLLPYALTCWVDNIRLEWDMQSMTVKNPQGVLTRVPGFGDTSSIEALDSMGLVKYMKPLVDYLVRLGYRKGKNIRGAPYDFRYSPDYLPSNYHNKLKNLIEETYTHNGNEKVTLISHSYGCPVTLYFLSLQSTEWKTKYLKQWIALSGVFGGSKQLVLLYSSGYLEGIPQVIIDRLTIRAEQRSSTSNLFLLPSETVWKQDNIFATTRKRSYKLSDMDDFLKDIGFPEGVAMKKHMINTTHLMNTSPGVPIHCFHGNIADSTISKLVFDDDFPDSPSQLILGPGDGTVNQESLTLCRKFTSLQQQPVTVKEVSGANHNGVIGHTDVLESIKKLL